MKKYISMKARKIKGLGHWIGADIPRVRSPGSGLKRMGKAWYTNKNCENDGR